MFWKACKLFLLLTLLTGFLYPIFITIIAQLTMPYQANGSLLKVNGQIRGSTLLAQPFTQDRYFFPRPSAMDYKGDSSAGSYLGPTSKKLKEIVAKRAQQLSQSLHIPLMGIPTDLLYTSGSGLDPHISPDAAYLQLDRITMARGLSPKDQAQLRQKMDKLVEGRQLGLFGPKYFNVLKLNQLLDEHFNTPSQQ